MLKIAITGGMASGKSTVSQYISELGYPVYDADKIYAELLLNNKTVAEIYDILGMKPAVENGKIIFDRKAVSEKVFSDKSALKRLNEYTHKLVYDEIDKLVEKNIDRPLLFFEIPLLFESKREKDFDAVLVVMRDKNERIDAVKCRSGLTREQALSRMNNQIDYDNFDFSKHTLIYNDGDLTSLKQKVCDVVKKIKEDNKIF